MLIKGANVNHQDRKGATVLHYAVEDEGDDEEEDFFKLPSGLLLNGKANLNLRDNDKYTPLHKAVIGDCPKYIELLLTSGADIEAKGGQYDMTPLHTACWSKSPNAVKVLLAHGANAKAKCSYDDNLPIHTAARSGSTTSGTLLLEHDKSCINAKDSDGWTPLHIAARWNSLDFARLLIKYGANPHAVTHIQNTPRDVTVPIVHYKMRKLLEEAERAKSPPLRLNRDKSIYL
jgi:ankyrin repeat protein